MRYIITIFEQMGIIDRVRWSAGRTISKGREGLNSIIDSMRTKPTENTIDYTLESLESNGATTIGTEPAVPDTAEDDDVTQMSEVPEEGPVTVARPVPESIPLVKRSNKFTRSFGATSRSIDKANPPRGLSFVGLVALVFASLYLMKLLTSLEAMQEDMYLLKRLVAAGMLLFLFYQYIGYVITIFQLRSGLRWSWATMVRSSGTYVLLMIVAETHIFDWLPFDLVSFPSWILMLAMAMIMVYMMLPSVRAYYKPAYADMAPLWEWFLFVFWIDPYKSSDDLRSDVDIDIEL